MIRKTTLLIAFITIYISTTCNAQNITIETEVPDSVFVEKEFKVCYTINANANTINATFSDDFRVISGPNISSSSKIQIQNGNVIKSYEKNYSYILMLKKTGRFALPVTVITADSIQYYSKPINVEAFTPPISIDGNQKTDTIAESDLFAELLFSKHEVYLQEPIIASLKIYSKVSLEGLKKLVNPYYDDFLQNDLQGNKEISFTKETINGSVYQTAIIKQVLLYPQRTGKISIEQTELQINAKIKKAKGKKESAFDAFFDDNQQTITKTIKTKAQTIIVHPFPKQKVDHFINICGRDINVALSLANKKIQTNNPFILELSLSGSGNLKMVSAPSLQLPDMLKVVSTEVIHQTTDTIQSIKGIRTFRYTIVSGLEGEIEIPSQSLSYFDLDSAKYKTLTTQSISLLAEKGNGQHELYQANAMPIHPKEIKKSASLIVLDISGSMLVQDFKPDRLNACLDKTNAFIQNQQNDVGLVVFAQNGLVQCPLTSNQATITDSIHSIPKLKLADGTAIGMGLGLAVNEFLEDNSKYKNIILLTDGVNNSGAISPRMAAYLANKNGIRVYTIGLGSLEKEVPYPVNTQFGEQIHYISVEIDEKVLTQIAQITGGKYYRATDNNSLDSIYEEIAQNISKGFKPAKEVHIISDDIATKILDIIKQDTTTTSHSVK